MNVSRTDCESSIQSNEFEWDATGCTEVHKYVMPIIEKWICKADIETVLDLGCGNGALTNAISKLGKNCVGFDMSSSGVAIAAKQYPESRFEVSSMDKSLRSDFRSSFDAVICVEVVEHLLLPRMLFKRAREALRPGGELIVTTPYHGYWKNLMIALAGGFDVHWHPLRDYGHVKFFSKATLGRLFEEEGFVVNEITLVGRIPALARSMMFRGKLLG